MPSSIPRLRSSLIVLIYLSLSWEVSNSRPQSLPQIAISPNGIWKRVDPQLVVIDKLKLSPKVFEAFELDLVALTAVLRTAPLESAHEGPRRVIITLPVPKGSFSRFKVVASPIIEPKLANRYPWLKSYKASGLDDRTANARLELTPEGFHAMVLSSSGTLFIDPASRKNPRHYISYLKSNLPIDKNRLRCGVRKARVAPEGRQQPALLPHVTVAARRGFVRVYRLAVAASHKYVAAIHDLNNPTGPPQDLLPDALTAIHRTVDRINLIYESEVGIRFVLVGDEDKIVFTREAGDPYVDSDTNDHLLDLNQVILDQKIGSQNYDVGHLFLGRGGGQASQPSACNEFFKAMGLTGRVDPQGDAFDVDYVAHEMGHEFGASHSFNGTSLFCDRNADTAYEPASGSTVMAYAGPTLCGPESIQNHSDAYFHAISLSEINDFLTSSDPEANGSCAQRLLTGDSFRPVVSAGVNRIIPKETPFTLTVSSSGDGDGDALVYSWEEFDLGDPDPPIPADPLDIKKIRPIFRTRFWSPDLSRTFPLLADILVKPPAGTFTAESLPPQNRTMRFRVTARDLRGRYGLDDMRVKVVADRRFPGKGLRPVGPFVVTQPATSVVWQKRSRQTVRWSVANTDVAPVNCSVVKISLLMRGDESHPIVLVTSTPNNGVRSLRIPQNLPLGNARVKVEAVNNIFFNISAGDVEITP